jgi:hypothetical protein
VANNPTYFVGTYEPERRENPSWQRLVEPLVVTTLLLASMGAVLWIIRAIVDHRRWLRISRVQTEAYSKILERFSSNEELFAFIQTAAGRRFLESSSIPLEPRAASAPVGRILWSVQAGFVLLFAGVGMEMLSYSTSIPMEVTQVLFVMGGLLLAMGVGFVLSGLASYGLSRRFGLLTPSAGETSAGSSGPPGTS